MPDRSHPESPCPDLADLLLASEGELPKRRQTEVTAHLRSCARCREQLGSVGLAMREYQDAETKPHVAGTASEVAAERLDLFRSRLRHEQREQNGRESRFPVRRWLPIAAAIPIIVGALLFSNRYSSVVRAEELLTRAAAQEQSAPVGTVRRLQFHVRRTGTTSSPKSFTREVGLRTVSASTAASAAPANDDDRELRRLLDANHFGASDPLSVRSFRAWRDSLTQHTDSVRLLGNDAIALRTETTDGVLRSAELIVRRVDFQPLRQTLSFDGFGEIEIIELSRWIAPAAPLVADRSTAPAPAASSPVAEPAAPTTEELDEAELDVRRALHDQAADGLPDLAVTRTARDVEVRGAIDSKRKGEIARAFHGSRSVRILLRSPDPSSTPSEGRTITASVAFGLWLDRTFGRSERAATFMPLLLWEAEQVQRRTAAFAALATRYPQSATANLAEPARQKLDALVDAHYRDLTKAIQALDDRVALFLGSSTRRAPALSAPRPWQPFAAAMPPLAASMQQSIDDLLHEENLPLPTDIDPNRQEPETLANLRRVSDALWKQMLNE